MPEKKEVSMTKEEMKELFNRRFKRPGDMALAILEQDKMLIAPGTSTALDAQFARMIYLDRKEKDLPCAYNSVYVSGWGASVIDLALPDMGFHDRTRIAEKAWWSARAAYPLPIIMDAEAGFGSEIHIPLLVERYHHAGVAIAHLEDQISDKRFCGHLAGRQVISIPDFEKKLRSWLEASEALNTTMLLMGRTDSIGAVNGGLENAIERGKRYMDVQCNGRRISFLWAEFDTPDPKPIETWMSAMQKYDPTMPIAFNYSPNKNWPKWYREHQDGAKPPTYQDLYSLGVRLVFHTIICARSIMESVWMCVESVAEKGPQALWELQDRQEGKPYGDPQKMSNALDWQKFDQFLSGTEGTERYERSGGFRGTGGKGKI